MRWKSAAISSQRGMQIISGQQTDSARRAGFCYAGSRRPAAGYRRLDGSGCYGQWVRQSLNARHRKNLLHQYSQQVEVLHGISLDIREEICLHCRARPVLVNPR